MKEKRVKSSLKWVFIVMMALGLSGCGDDEQGTSKSFDEQHLITDVFSDITINPELGSFTIDMEIEVPANSYVRISLSSATEQSTNTEYWLGFLFLDGLLNEKGLLSNKSDTDYNISVTYDEQISFISSDEVQINYNISGSNGLKGSKTITTEVDKNAYVPVWILYIYDHDATSFTDYKERKTYRIGNPQVKISDYYIHDTTISTEDVK
jgi:hypothetical protein